MDNVRRVATSVEQVIDEAPGGICLTSAVVDAGARAVACYRTGEKPGDHTYWVSYMEDDDVAQTRPAAVEGGGGEAMAPPAGHVVRYLRSFRGEQAGFRAGIDYAFFASNLVSEPTEDPPDEQLRAEYEAGSKAIENKIIRRRLRFLYDEMLAAEEAAGRTSSISERDGWREIAAQAEKEIQNLTPEPDKHHADLRFHRYRRAAVQAERERTGEDL